MDARIVEAGKLLDVRHPGWASKIDTNKLVMTDGSHCILGQLYGRYVDSPTDLRYNDSGSDYRWAFHSYAKKEHWIEAIKMRTEVKHLSGELLAIKTFDEFVAWRDKVTDREITVTIKASDARLWLDFVHHPAAPAKAVHTALTEALKQ